MAEWPFLSVGEQADYVFVSDMDIDDGELRVMNVNCSATLDGAAQAAFDDTIPTDTAFVAFLNVAFYSEGDGPFITIRGGTRTQIPVAGVGMTVPVVVLGGDGSGMVIDSLTGTFNEDYRISGISIQPVAYTA